MDLHQGPLWLWLLSKKAKQKASGHGKKRSPGRESGRRGFEDQEPGVQPPDAGAEGDREEEECAWVSTADLCQRPWKPVHLPERKG